MKINGLGRMVCVGWVLGVGAVQAQDATLWTLRGAIDYALENNITVKRQEVNTKIMEENVRQAKAQQWPTLSLSAGEDLRHYMGENGDGNYKSKHSWSESYGASSGVTLFEGFRIKNNIRMQELNLELSETSVATAKQKIEIAITESYLNILYAKEAIRIDSLALETSEKLLEQAAKQRKAGAITEADYAKLKSEVANDRYLLAVAENNLQSRILDFKQLLELGIEDTPELYYPEIADETVEALPPGKKEVYEVALGWMPQIKQSDLEIRAAELDMKLAEGLKWPTLNLSGSASTGHNSVNKERYGAQLNHNFTQSLGLSAGWRIFNHRETRSAIEKAKWSLETAKLEKSDAEKDLLKAVEDVYLNTVSAQQKFIAAREALASAETAYKLVEDKFKAGAKTVYEYTEERNNYLKTEQNYLQAKYEAVLNRKLLDYYMNVPLDL